ncbi:hypothetical protein WCLP8_4830005 [uncultured Gammaproteobacteria bacterium]
MDSIFYNALNPPAHEAAAKSNHKEPSCSSRKDNILYNPLYSALRSMSSPFLQMLSHFFSI